MSKYAGLLTYTPEEMGAMSNDRLLRAYTPEEMEAMRNEVISEDELRRMEEYGNEYELRLQREEKEQEEQSHYLSPRNMIMTEEELERYY